MFTLLKKEINSFFNSPTGYIVIIVFLLINSLIMWVFPGELNILDGGYASLDTLFIIAPWVFLILIPAITMRMFTEEKKNGTLDLLMTRPVSDMQIVLMKYFAGLLLVLLSLIPTLLFFLSVYLLGNPVGNIDTGGTWGSFIALFFLATVYVAVGIFTSSFSDNIIIAFLFSVVLSFILFFGFESLSTLFTFSKIGEVLAYIGISTHYSSMSRGVIYVRDMIYFISTATVFILFTKILLSRRRW